MFDVAECYVAVHMAARTKKYIIAEFFENKGDILVASNGILIEEENGTASFESFDEYEISTQHYHLRKLD